MTFSAAYIKHAVVVLALVVYLLSNYQIQEAISAPTEESHGTMQMEQIAERSGKMNEVLHYDRIMLEVNSYKITNNINNSQIHDSGENKFLVVDLSVRSISHALKLSPNMFILKSDVGEIAPRSG